MCCCFSLCFCYLYNPEPFCAHCNSYRVSFDLSHLAKCNRDIYIIIVLRKDEFCVPGRKSMNFWETRKILLTYDRISMKIWENLLEPHIPDLHTFSIHLSKVARFSYLFNLLLRIGQICILFQSPCQNLPDCHTFSIFSKFGRLALVN